MHKINSAKSLKNCKLCDLSHANSKNYVINVSF